MPAVRFNPVGRDFCFSTKQPLGWPELRLRFQSRWSGFLFFYPNSPAMTINRKRCFNPVGRDFCFSTLSDHKLLLDPDEFQSRWSGFLFFYGIVKYLKPRFGANRAPFD
jgi:hypothetical protein